VSDATKPEPGKAEPAKSSDSGAAQPSLLSELNELQSPTTVQELEVVHASASALISDAVAEAAAKRETIPPPIAPPFIDFDHVSIGFGDRKILDNVSFHLGRGQTLCILGRSGVGKSVSLRILLGFLKPDSGCVRVDGQDIASLDARGLQEVRKHVTMVFQNGALFDSLSVGENIAFPLREKGGLQEDQIQQLVARLLDLVGASETVNLLPSSLSTGQRRCIAIARALAAQPEAILYDEPTTMVDPIMARSIGDLIQRLKLQLGITSIVVTHDMRFAIRLADLVLFLESGTARFFGTIKEFVECPDPHVQQFFALDAYVLPEAATV
jgi:phospholipid/cholesterol/gamma-HCH transport system ATP-binding protein